MEREGRMRPTLARAVRDHEAAGNAVDEAVAEAVWADGEGEAAAMDVVDDAAAMGSGRGGSRRGSRGRRRSRQARSLPRDPAAEARAHQARAGRRCPPSPACTCGKTPPARSSTSARPSSCGRACAST
ncbi:MAG: hypothetical protein ACLTDR_00440 [Adlercreutzia equolifaciens]